MTNRSFAPKLNASAASVFHISLVKAINLKKGLSLPELKQEVTQSETKSFTITSTLQI
tara:strand:+ start:255 stop:428 length:174 start_codon:yes stop_codon:yes gene_type:complete